MKRLILGALILLCATSTFAANPGRYMHWDREYTTDGDLPACDGRTGARVAFTNDDGKFQYCPGDGSDWVDITVSGAEPSFDSLTVGGDVDITGDADIVGSLSVDNIDVNGNTISSTDSNGNVTIDPNGSGVTAVTGPLTVSTTAVVTGKATFSERIVNTPQAFSVADSGDGSAAAGTLTPSSSVVACTCNDTDGCALTFSETGAAAGQLLTIYGAAANACTIADSAGVQETTGSLSLGANDTVQFVYTGSAWIQSAAVVNN